MIALAIDIGLTGALAAVDSYGTARVVDLVTVPDGKPVQRKNKQTGKVTISQPMRLCGRALLLAIRQFVPPGEPARLVFEDVRPRPMGNGGAHGNTMHSQGSLMRSRGIVEAVADIARLTVSTAQPATWKRHFNLLKTEKGASREKACALYPLLAGDLKLVKHHNRAEAVLLAHWLQWRAA